MACAKCKAPMLPGAFRLHCSACAKAIRPAGGTSLRLGPAKPQPDEAPQRYYPSNGGGNWEFAAQPRKPAGTKNLNGLEGAAMHQRGDPSCRSPVWDFHLSCRCGGEAHFQLPAPAKPKHYPKQYVWLALAPFCRCGSRIWNGAREIWLIKPPEKKT